MLTRMKRFILILLLMFTIIDCCTYTRIMNIADVNVSSFHFFYSQVSNGSIAINTSIIYLVVVSLIVFVRYMFSDSNN